MFFRISIFFFIKESGWKHDCVNELLALDHDAVLISYSWVLTALALPSAKFLLNFLAHHILCFWSHFITVLELFLIQNCFLFAPKISLRQPTTCRDIRSAGKNPHSCPVMHHWPVEKAYNLYTPAICDIWKSKLIWDQKQVLEGKRNRTLEIKGRQGHKMWGSWPKVAQHCQWLVLASQKRTVSATIPRTSLVLISTNYKFMFLRTG